MTIIDTDDDELPFQASSIEVRYCRDCGLPHVFLFDGDDDQPFAMFTIDDRVAEVLRPTLTRMRRVTS